MEIKTPDTNQAINRVCDNKASGLDFTGFLFCYCQLLRTKVKKISSLDNYRQFKWGKFRISEFIRSTDNQFGLNTKHCTDVCIYALKEIINKYRSLNSSVFTCLNDASKAFYCVNERKWFIKLKKRGVNIGLLWYANQSMQDKWCDSVSGPFRVSNDVRQGEILVQLH